MHSPQILCEQLQDYKKFAKNTLENNHFYLVLSPDLIRRVNLSAHDTKSDPH